MADNKKVQEDLKKLEDQAYFELCQIIAEAMQYQDIELLNARISYWKNKYKKLLDRPSTNSKSDFKKRIEFLLNQYYSSVTQYILNQLKLKEQKMIKNQSKAVRELYNIIRDTNDLDLLRKKIKKWETKYPISGFLRMYQKRIESYTREKNLKENAFEQEKAFSELVSITKINGTLDELKSKLTRWEKNYSINNKFNIDDFIKHQTEVKRYTSDEFLQSIAREEIIPDNVPKSNIKIIENLNNRSFSKLSVQASAYAALLKISQSPNAVSEMFTWVYKNSHIKFNNEYKEMIISATSLEYSPAYLSKLPKPKMDNSLSFEEYTNINDIKRYAIISYLNLLLPTGKSVSNNYFNSYISTIYSKSEKARISNYIEDKTTSIEEILDSGIEFSFKNNTQKIPTYNENKLDLDIKDSSINETTIEDLNKEEIVIDLKNAEPELIIDLKNPSIAVDNSNTIVEELPSTNTEKVIEDYKFPLDENSIIILSPLFFNSMNNYITMVNSIDSTTTKYVERQEKSKEEINEFSLDELYKTKID